MNIKCEPIGVYTKKDIEWLSMGGFTFTINNESLCFDFDASSAFIEENDCGIIISWESGRGALFDEYDVSEDYAQEYEEAGLTREMITAKLLSEATCLEEISYDIGNSEIENIFVRIKDITFEDENDNVYRINPLVIEKYNLNHLLENQEEIKNQLYGGK